MHELSIAQSLIEAACEAAKEQGATCVERLNLRIGAMSGVVTRALTFSFELAAEGTLCDGAALVIEEVPVTVYCPVCDAAKTPPNAYILCCPTCGSPTPEILSGRELELVSLEINKEVDAHAAACA